MIFPIVIAVFALVILLAEEVRGRIERARPGPLPASVGPFRPRAIRRRALSSRLEALHISPSGFYLLSTFCALLGLGIGVLFGLPILFALALAGLGALLPTAYLSIREEAQARELDRELPAALEDLAGTMRVRASTADALREVARVCRQGNPTSPLARELDHLLADAEVQGMERALLALQERAPSPDLARLAGMLLAFHQAGPDMLDLLAEQARRLRSTLQLQAEIRANISEHRLTMRLAPLLAAFTYFFLTTDPSVRAFQRSVLGQALALVVAGIMFLGYLVIRTQIQDAEP
ncbi:MAG: type II secretion system F family protein [Chloroflexia bacterium]